MSSKHPRHIDATILDSFASQITEGEYIVFPSSGVPDGIPTGGPSCQAVVIAASGIYSSDIPNMPPQLSPSGTVYLWRGFRTLSSGDPPRKVDDALFYASSDGTAWSLHSKHSPDHHNNILSSTDMVGLINDWDLPAEQKGSIKQYRQGGANLDFLAAFGDEIEE